MDTDDRNSAGCKAVVLQHRYGERLYAEVSWPPSTFSVNIRSLLRLHCAIGQELIDRKVTRSTNNPAEDCAECFFANALALTFGKAKRHDAVDPSVQTAIEIVYFVSLPRRTMIDALGSW